MTLSSCLRPTRRLIYRNSQNQENPLILNKRNLKCRPSLRALIPKIEITPLHPLYSRKNSLKTMTEKFHPPPPRITPLPPSHIPYPLISLIPNFLKHHQPCPSACVRIKDRLHREKTVRTTADARVFST